MPKTYVVFVGRKPGIYENWYEANSEVSTHSGASFRGYNTRKEAKEAFDRYLKKDSDVSTCSQPTISTSNSTVTSNNESKTCKNLSPLLEAVSDFAHENRKLAKKMEKNSEKIAILLEQMEMSEE